MDKPLIFPRAASRRTVLGGGFALAAAASALADGALSPARGMERARPGPSSMVVELRQYTLHPGRRDELVALFDAEFLEAQEDCGARVIAEFRDLDRPEMFVWLRGYPDMAARVIALTDFYSGPVWQEHRAAANATMVDSDNVLLLRPARAGSGFKNEWAARPPQGAAKVPPTVVTATIWTFEQAISDATLARFEREAAPILMAAEAPAIASFVTESAANNFPALPVREGESVLVWFSVFENEAGERAAAAALDASLAWNAALDSFAHDFTRAPETLRLSPTARSRALS